jgi:NAD(P)-dependent dehydrogenase (short-subunit alcohol dehydrogenase family)
VVKLVNFASFDSVRAFAKDVNASEERLDILVNNAGAGGIGDKKSKDGLVLLMQVNYFASFLLTNLLIGESRNRSGGSSRVLVSGLLKRSAPSRVVNVSSLAARFANFHLDDLNKFTGIHNCYANSKVCNILFTKELAKKLEGTSVTTYSLHPGTVQTDIFRHMEKNTLFDLFKESFFKTSEEGAQTNIYLSVAKGIEDLNGEHFDNCTRVETYKSADVPGLAHKLWEKTEKFVELKPEEVQF